MKLFIEITTILSLSLLVGFSQGRALDDCTTEVKRYHGHAWETITVPKNTPECVKRREQILGAIPRSPNEKKDNPASPVKRSNSKDKDVKLTKSAKTPNLKRDTQEKREKTLLPKSEEDDQNNTSTK